ncbi:MAG TPA: adenylyltransferase/cytidyltransferase family protein [Candidatus Acidoferrales bacterium]|nr:adenylyltransferase/cytidyltransferase family protein [Candidatus Acidoferrales bacterium]
MGSRARGPRRGPVRVFVAGTFDGLHYGHVYLLKFARRAGDRWARRFGRLGVHLSVVVARDESVRRIKGRLPHHTQRQRRDLLAALRLVDDAFVGYRDNFVRSVRRARPDLIVLGYDQSKAWEEVLRRSGVDVPVVRCTAFNPTKLKSSMMRADFVEMKT